MTDITEFLCRDYKAFQIGDTIADVQEFFAETHFSHFPVLEEKLYLGSISADDAETLDTEKSIGDFRYTLEGFYARSNMIWLDLMEVFARNQSNVVPVLDDQNLYAGYYEVTDIIKFFHETPFLKEQGGIFIVEKGMADYSMGQIAQIVESNNGKILGSFVSAISGDQVQVTVKIALGSINEIIQTFRRYDYKIISEHQEDNYLNNLKERSEYLDKYLNI